jgi:hypothetical protein
MNLHLAVPSLYFTLVFAGCAGHRSGGGPASQEMAVTYAQPVLADTQLELVSLEGPNAATFRHQATGGTFSVERGQRLPVLSPQGLEYVFKSADLPAGKAIITVRLPR